MEEIDELLEIIKSFQLFIGSKKDSVVHTDNNFHKQISVLDREARYLKIVWDRIAQGSKEDITQLNFDLKTMYVFGRVFSESLIYISSLFFSTENINWKKISEFIKTTEKNLNSQNLEFKEFWESCRESIKNLYTTFKYRNSVLHDKKSNTEWTFINHAGSNLDNVTLENIPWHPENVIKETKTLNARTLISILIAETKQIVSYLQSIIS